MASWFTERSGKNLSGADLSEADLSGADLSEVVFRDLVWCRATRWPDSDLEELMFRRSDEEEDGQFRIRTPRTAD